MGKSLKQFVFETVEKNGDITDQEVYNFTKGEHFNFITVTTYKNIARKTIYLRKEFKELVETGRFELEHFSRGYYISPIGEVFIYRINKEYYKELKIKKYEKIYNSRATRKLR